MTERMYRLLERHQKLDAMLSKARMRRIVDPLEVAWLAAQKLKLKRHLSKLSSLQLALA